MMFTLLLLGLAQSSRVFLESTRGLYTPETLPDWQLVAQAPRDAEIIVSFAVKLQNLDTLKQKFKTVSDPRSSDYGNYWNRGDLAAFSPKPQDIALVKEWVTSSGARVLGVTGNNGFVRASMKVEHAEKMFAVSIQKFGVDQHVIYRTLEHYSVPEEVGAVLDFVSGLAEFPIVRRSRSSAPRAAANSVTPTILKKLYEITEAGSGKSNSSQACAEFQGQAFSHSDLAAFEKQFQIPAQPVRRVMGSDTNTGGIEANLDVQYIIGVAPGIPTDMWLDNNGTNGFDLVQWAGWVLDTPETPLVWSISYGLNMDKTAKDYANRLDAEFQKLASLGVSIMVASGDGGVWCRSALHIQFQACFPAGLPSVTSVGATKLDADQGETTVIPFSGGGFTDSSYFTQPTWQAKAVAGYLANTGGDMPAAHFYDAKGRGIPDVSAQGVDFTIYEHGQPSGVSGTSASCPTFAAVVSLLNDQRLLAGKPAMGFLNPFLYQNEDCFRDIQKGKNSNGALHGFPALKNWDAATGLGTPLYPKLKAAALAAI